METFKSVLLEILCISLLLTPLFWEVHDDRNGDTHPSKSDIWHRIGLSLLSCFFVWMVGVHTYTEALVMSFGLFTSIFPYVVNYAQRDTTEDPRWWSHLSKTAWPDRVPVWRKIGWRGRLFVNLCILLTSIIIYA